jgi:hypothetical protein
MDTRTTAEIVKNSKKSYFQFYRDGNLFYKTDNDFEFNVPLNDVGQATLEAEEKTILLMRWIRKHVEVLRSQYKMNYLDTKV